MVEPALVALARDAVARFGHDVRATTNLEPPPFEHRDEDGGIRLAYWGQYATMWLLGTTAPEIAVEVADFMQGEVMEELHAAWPECTTHRIGLHPELVLGQASWVCRAGGHVMSEIGNLSE